MILRAFAPHVPAIEIGASYRRSSLGSMTETAHVLEMGMDKLGIPHVRFTLQVGNGCTQTGLEARTLSLEAFQSRYREKILKEQCVNN